MTATKPEFVPGLQLSAAFYLEAVRPILDTHFPQLSYSAGLMGYGSDVLGLDTSISTDHEWGPRLLLFLSERDHAELAEPVDQALRAHLPATFYGYSTNFSDTQPIQWQMPLEAEAINYSINHKVRILTTRAFIEQTLSFDTGANTQTSQGYATLEIGVVDWLLFPEQRLLEITRGRVFHDGLDELEPLRSRFGYFPELVWLYLMAAQWSAIAQEEAFVGRAGAVDDELGSRLIAARQVQRLMKLAFLMERQYAPYSKWFGSAFAQLTCAGELAPILQAVLAADTWPAREAHLSAAYIYVAQRHNALQITQTLETDVTDYYDRPYQVLFADRFADAIFEQIHDPVLRTLPKGVGAIDQFITNVDILTDGRLCRKLEAIFA